MSKREKLTFSLIAIYVVILSFAPLLSDLIVEDEWIGYGTGSYYYKTERLEVRISSIGEGSGKPRIYLFAPNMSYRPVLLIEMDDRESMADGQSLFHDLRNITIRVQDDKLIYTYELEGLIVKKIIAPGKDHINVTILSEEPAELKIVMRGRNYTSVNSVYLSRHQEIVDLGTVDKVELYFNVRGIGNGIGIVRFFAPVKASVHRDGGSSKIVVERYGRELSMMITGEIRDQPVSEISIATSEALNHGTLKYLLPLIAIVSVAGGWLIWRRG